MALRVAKIIGGAFLALANSSGEPGTFAGLFTPDSLWRAGWDAAKLLIYGLCGWLIYRGLRPKLTAELVQAERK